MIDLNAHLDTYKTQGFSHFPAVYDEDTMAAWRAESDRLTTTAGPHHTGNNWWHGNMLEKAPHLMWPAVTHPLILDFAETVAGPFVQLDNLTLAGFPSQPDAQPHTGIRWHRDRWAHLPLDIYERPLAMNAICYLQDMDDAYGPLRVIPGSHIEPISMTAETGKQPHPDEQLVYAKAGDVIFTHHGLLHSGTANSSGKTRYFFSIYLNISWLKPTDTFAGPSCQRLIQQARENHDVRGLRLLGADPTLTARNNWGMLGSDSEVFANWIAEDRGKK